MLARRNGACWLRVNRVVLTVRRLLPVYSDEQTFAVSDGMSRMGHLGHRQLLAWLLVVRAEIGEARAARPRKAFVQLDVPRGTSRWPAR